MRKIAAGIAAASAVALVAGVAPAASAATGEKSLAAVLTSDGNTFDRNSYDYDIVTEAVVAVLKNNPNSPVSVLAAGSTPVTAFVPNDQAFRLLVKDLTGTTVWSEQKVFEAVAGLGLPTVETVLLYHVVPGKTITAGQALKSNNAVLPTAQGGTIKVQVRGIGSHKFVRLVDKDPNARNPVVMTPNINKGNKQIAHGITRVLRPLDLPPTVK
jgi:uncharacterized surface protein with fasciclin (FAS1) repeats